MVNLSLAALEVQDLYINFVKLSPNTDTSESTIITSRIKQWTCYNYVKIQKKEFKISIDAKPAGLTTAQNFHSLNFRMAVRETQESMAPFIPGGEEERILSIMLSTSELAKLDLSNIQLFQANVDFTQKT